MKIIAKASMDLSVRGTVLELREGEVLDVPDEAAEVAIGHGFAEPFDPDDVAPAEPTTAASGPDSSSGPEEPGDDDEPEDDEPEDEEPGDDDEPEDDEPEDEEPGDDDEPEDDEPEDEEPGDDDEPEDDEPEDEEPGDDDEPEDEAVDWPDGVSPKAIAALEGKGLDPERATAMSDEQLLEIPNVGPGTIRAIRQAQE